MTELRAGDHLLRLAPEVGGAIAAWSRGGEALLHPVSDPKLHAQHGAAVAAYPLIPFSNRVRDGRFRFGGEAFQLAPNFGDSPHTIHGNAWMHPWTVEAAGPDHATLAFEHLPPRDDPAEWPFAFRAEQRFRLRPDGLDVDVTVLNRDARPFPCGMGLHPFFPRGDVELGFAAAGVWHTRPDGLPDARLPAEGPWRFEPPRRPDGPPIDNCYTGWGGRFTLRWPSRRLRITVSAGAPFGHAVLFTPPGKDFLATEPASNMTDAVNRMETEPDQGLVVLAPGETLRGSVRFDVEEE